MSNLKRREYVYVRRPKAYEISGCAECLYHEYSEA